MPLLKKIQQFVFPFNLKSSFSLTIGLFIIFNTIYIDINAQTTVQYQWKNVKIGGGGFVTGIITCPTKKDLIYARTDVGGAYRWNVADSSWIPLLDWVSPGDWLIHGVESIAIDPSDPNCLYMACGMYAGNNYGVFLKSKDQGKNFTISSNITPMGGNDMGRSNGERLVVDPNKGSTLFFGSRKGGLWTSIDSAKTWKQVTGFPVTTTSNSDGIIFVKFLKSSGQTGKATPVIYSGISRKGDNNLYCSSDSGTTWQAIANQPIDLYPQHFAVDNDTALYITYSDGQGPWGITAGKVWRYSRNSSTWTEITPNDKRYQGGFGGVSVDPQHPGTVMVSTMNDYWPHDLVFRSTDNGKTWTELLVNATYDYKNCPVAATNNVHWTGDLQIDPLNSDHVLITTGYGIWSTFDATKADLGQSTHWVFADNGIEECVPTYLVSPPSGDAILLSVIGDFDGFRHTSLNSIDSAARHKPNAGTTTSIDFAENNPNVVARVCDNSTKYGYYSLDGGKTWTLFPTLPNISAVKGYIAVSSDGSTFVWAPDALPTYYTRDKGTTWYQCTGLAAGNRPIADRVNPNKFYSYDGNFYISTDGGATFTKTSSLFSGGGFPRAIPGTEGDVWVPLKGSGLKHTTDGGFSFTGIKGVQEAYGIGLGKPAPNQTYPALYLLGKYNNIQGVFRSDDIGITWRRINDDQHQYGGFGNAVITGDPRFYGRVFFSTGGRGIIYGESYDCTGVLNGSAYYDKCNICVGGNTGLTPCPGTAVLEVPETSNIKILPNPFVTSLQIKSLSDCNYTVFDIQGKQVEAGTCKGECQVGANLTPGMYLLKVKNKNEAQTFKIVKQP